MSEDKHAEHRRLLEELDRLEEEQRTMDLRDPHAVEACQRKIAELRKKIQLFDLRDREKSSTRRGPALLG
jgi:hypothetical protein